MIKSFIQSGHGLYDNFWLSIKRNMDLNRFYLHKIFFSKPLHTEKFKKKKYEELKKTNFDILSRPNYGDFKNS